MKQWSSSGDVNPVRVEIYRNLFASVAEEMGTVLKRSAYSPNIKERRDYSCAVFDAEGQVLAMGDHMPVHLGSMPLSVAAALGTFPMSPGDIVILNDPFSGGTHLPDITIIAPVFATGGMSSRPTFYVASRAHHSDVGGISAGSMPLSREIFQEGVRIPPLKLYEAGELNRSLLKLLLYNVRTPREREGDLAAQVGALKVGERRLYDIVERNGSQEVEQAVDALHTYAERTTQAVLTNLPDGVYRAEDQLDDGGLESADRPVCIRVELRKNGDRLQIDFKGTDPQVPGCLNAVYAITVSACYYVLRCLAPDDVPLSAGLLRPVEVTAPEGSVVNARFPAATAAGNVETSQRIVDVLLRAFAEVLPDVIPAASSGTMNNVTVGGIDPATRLPFSYYETIGGGMGAGPGGDGDSGVHTHMTNSLNTPVEALERYFPFRIACYRLRARSGGRGRFRGGDGIVRMLEAAAECEVTILSERRAQGPWGLQGGEDGKPGANFLVGSQGRRKRIRGKDRIRLSAGDALLIETPGGGGWGRRQ